LTIDVDLHLIFTPDVIGGDDDAAQRYRPSRKPSHFSRVLAACGLDEGSRATTGTQAVPSPQAANGFLGISGVDR
jgi:hypothetical protein